MRDPLHDLKLTLRSGGGGFPDGNVVDFDGLIAFEKDELFVGNADDDALGELAFVLGFGFENCDHQRRHQPGDCFGCVYCAVHAYVECTGCTKGYVIDSEHVV